MGEDMATHISVVALNFCEDVRTIDRCGPSLERSVKSRLVLNGRDPPQFRTSVELRPRHVEAEYGVTLVLDTTTMEPTAYREHVLVLPRTVAVSQGESVFCFPPLPSRTVYKSTLVYDTRRADLWYTSAVDLAVVGTLGVPVDDDEEEEGEVVDDAAATSAGDECFDTLNGACVDTDDDDDSSSRL
ncbi:uncharacterized protein LOC119389658 [Rhipicephalus sanguineus]|uniref:Uncharacterized protein n=1 Tax=Rhipicephalus sanguineus TaxID=34632 RepID=A0A9D4SZ37_RHISA|nr:uncharacterized protein LOC119389658 [Rhipicephalus sanguineus]KAH7957548.1 hypothetical protein HPB52_020044 [Rhipicephalus sanguineus]